MKRPTPASVYPALAVLIAILLTAAPAAQTQADQPGSKTEPISHLTPRPDSRAAVAAEVLEHAALKCGRAAIDLAYLQDAISSLTRIAQWRSDPDPEPLATFQPHCLRFRTALDDLADQYLACYRLTVGIPYNGPKTPFSPAEIELRRDVHKVLDRLNDLLSQTLRLSHQISALRQQADAALSQSGAKPPRPITRSTPIKGTDLYHNQAGFVFSFMGPPFDGWNDIHRRVAPLLDRFPDHRSQRYVQHTSSGPGRFVFDDKGISLALTNDQPVELILPAGVDDWRHVPTWFAAAHAGDDSYLLWPGASQGPFAGTWDIWNAQVIEAHQDLVQAVAQHYQANPAVMSYRLLWEPNLGRTPDKMGGYTPAARTAFRQYVQNKYRSIDVLNRTWHKQYQSFAQIEPPAPEKFNLINPLAAEFRRFRYDSFSDFVNQDYRILKQADPTHPVINAPCSSICPTDTSALDLWQLFSQSSDIISLHYWYHNVTEDIFLYSINRYLNKTIANGEYYWNGGSETWAKYDEDNSAAEGIQNLWQTAAYGRSMFYLYGLADTFTPFGADQMRSCNNLMDFYTDYTRLRRSAGVLPMMVDKLRSVAPILRKLPIVEPQIALLLPSETLKNETDLFDGNSERGNLDMLNNILYRNNYHYAIIPDEAFLEEKDSLDHYRVLMAPAALYVSSQLHEQTTHWVSQGGTLVITGQPFAVFDPLGLPSGHLLKQAFGPNALQYTRDDDTDTFSYQWQGPPCSQPIVKSFGRGKIILTCPRPEGKLLAQFERRLLDILQQSAPRQAWCAPNTVRLVLRQDQQQNLYLTAWNLSITDPADVQISIAGRYPRAEDLGIKGGYEFQPSIVDATTNLSLSFGPGAGTIIRLSNQ